jgi:hypothetical protein
MAHSPHDRPDALELVDAVRDFLDDEVRGALEGRLAYHVRVASNALRIASRELRGASEIDARHAARLARFECGDDRELVAAIRSGALDERYAELGTELRRMVWDKIQVTNPRYVRPYTSPDERESTDGEPSTGG